MNKTTEQGYDESAPAIEDVIGDLFKYASEEDLANVVSDPEQERRDLIEIRDATRVLVERLDKRDRDIRKSEYGHYPALGYEVELDKLKAAINAQHYPDAR